MMRASAPLPVASPPLEAVDPTRLTTLAAFLAPGVVGMRSEAVNGDDAAACQRDETIRSDVALTQ